MSLDLLSDTLYEQWDDVCDWVEGHGGDAGRFVSKKFLRKISIEAPVIVGFCFLCTLIHLLSTFTGLNTFLAVEDYFSPWNPLQYVRLFTHIFAHSSIPHLKGNMVNLLLVGPSAEHVFGSYEMLLVMAVVAVTSGLAHIWVGSNYSHQLGASGVVFAVILLNSLVSAKMGRIPVSFLLTAVLWVSDELWAFFFAKDAVSHHAHLTGAAVGTAAGYYLHRRKEREFLKRGVIPKWKRLVQQKFKSRSANAATRTTSTTKRRE